MSKIREFMHKATTAEQAELAKRAKTSRNYLYVLSNGDREPQPGLAARIERASITMREKNPKLPPVMRTDLNSDCRRCEYARHCLGLKP